MKKKARSAASFFRHIANGSASIKTKSKSVYLNIVHKVENHPVQSFLVTLLLLLGLIVLGNLITKPKTAEEEKAKEPITVDTYSIGSAPKITVPAQVEKEGVIQITAQTAGIVNKVNVVDGQKVNKGQPLISLSSNYQGANAASVQRQLAGVQAQNAKVVYGAQQEIIAKQREIAQESATNSDDLRSIGEKSIDETKSLISLNDSILASLDSNLTELETTNIGGANDAAILQTKQLKSQFQAANNQAKSALRNTEFTSAKDKAPANLSSLQKDIALKQLDLQEKTLKLNLDAANLQVRLAQISESLFFPTSPFTGTVEKVHVRAAQQVTPGTVLVTISSLGKSQTAVAYVPQNTAGSVSKLDLSYLTVDKQKFEVTPIYVSTEAVQGQLYAIIFPIPKEAQNLLTDKGFVDIEIPIGYSYTSAATPYIPLDSVHQTQDKAIVFVITNGQAEAKTVTLGQVQGNFIEITSGLNSNDTVIISRNIVSGDSVKPKVL